MPRPRPTAQDITVTITVVLSLWASLAGAAPGLGAQDWNWDIALLDTARASPYLSETEKDVILELNKARSDPARYAEMYIRPRLTAFRGGLYSPKGGTPISTQEGVRAVEECYRAMRSAKPLGLLYPREGLSRGARDHVRDQGASGATGHYGRDGSDPGKRASRYGTGDAGENIAYGADSAAEIVRQLLIDDGVPDRGHRLNTLAPEYRYAGAAVGGHPRYGTMCVINFSESYLTAGNREEEREEAAWRKAVFSTRLAQDWEGWEALDGGGGAAFLSEYEKDILLELNKARSNPRLYAERYVPVTDSLYNALLIQPAAPALNLEKELCMAARDSGDLVTRLSRYVSARKGEVQDVTIEAGYSSGREAALALLRGYLPYALGQAYRYIGFSAAGLSQGVRVRVEFASFY